MTVSPTLPILANCVIAASEKASNLLTMKRPGSSPSSEKTYYCFISPPPLFVCASHCVHTSQFSSLCFSPLFDPSTFIFLCLDYKAVGRHTRSSPSSNACNLVQFWPTLRPLPAWLCSIPLIHNIQPLWWSFSCHTNTEPFIFKSGHIISIGF